MSTVEIIVVTCDERGCEAKAPASAVAAIAIASSWYTSSTLDLCPTHVRERVERPAPPAAPTAGTTSTEGITLALSARDAVWVCAAMERAVHGDPTRRELLRELHAQIEDYARSQA